MEITKFSQRLSALRKSKGLSQAELASKIGFPGHSQISRYEAAKSIPDVQTLIKIADVLEVDLHWLVTGEHSPQVNTTVTRLELMARFYLDLLNEKRRNLTDEATHLEEKAKGELSASDKNQISERLRKIEESLKILKSLYDNANKSINDLMGPFLKS